MALRKPDGWACVTLKWKRSYSILIRSAVLFSVKQFSLCLCVLFCSYLLISKLLRLTLFWLNVQIIWNCLIQTMSYATMGNSSDCNKFSQPIADNSLGCTFGECWMNADSFYSYVIESRYLCHYYCPSFVKFRHHHHHHHYHHCYLISIALKFISLLLHAWKFYFLIWMILECSFSPMTMQ